MVASSPRLLSAERSLPDLLQELIGKYPDDAQLVRRIVLSLLTTPPPKKLPTTNSWSV